MTTTIATIESLLESVLAETTDSEHHFMLRTALQLLAIVAERDAVAQQALSDCQLDDEVRQNLRELGYTM